MLSSKSKYFFFCSHFMLHHIVVSVLGTRDEPGLKAQQGSYRLNLEIFGLNRTSRHRAISNENRLVFNVNKRVYPVFLYI